MSAKVNANLFRIVAGFVSSEETRYYLQGVLIQRHPVKGVFLVATDGHRMMVAHDETGLTTLDDVIVKLDKNTLTACKSARNETADRALVVEGDGTVRVQTGDENAIPVVTAYKAIVDGTYPDWQRVARPNIDTPSPAAFNGQYLADFGKAAKELSGSKSGHLHITGVSDGPALLRFGGVDNAYGVLMPLRHKGETGLPAFMSATPVAPSEQLLAA